MGRVGAVCVGRRRVRLAIQSRQVRPGALALSEKQWAVQDEPLDVRVLREAAQAAKQPEAAAPVLAFLQQSKLEDPIIAPLARQLQARLDAKTVAR